MKLLKHLWSQPFIAATGAAALIHSTWSLGTFFSGEQPTEPLRLVLWLIPAGLIAFSLDVGQIATSAEIRAGQHSKAKYLTFATFALATYFLQFVYCASHMPRVDLAAGIRSEWLGIVTFIRDSGVFILPGLLPLSTLLYTFSQERKSGPMGPEVESASNSSTTALVPLSDVEQALVEERIEIECPDCEWAGVYPNRVSARNALTGHQAKHRRAVVSSNGNH